MTAQTPVLDVQQLTVEFATDPTSVVASRNISLTVHPGEIVAVVGESGSGKSALAMAIAGLLPDIASVNGRWNIGEQSFAVSGKSKVRPQGVGFIFQDPLSALNPAYTLGWQITEVLRVSGVAKSQCRKRGIELLEQVGMANPARSYDLYPHEVSGGMRQRAIIAIALANDPALIIADEPTTALDVSVQKQVLELLRKIVDERQIGLVLITHDLAVVAEVAQRVMVMYSGSLIELGMTKEVLGSPQHPYTRALLGCSLTLNSPRKQLIPEITGTVPQFGRELPHCPFLSRCTISTDICKAKAPAAISASATRGSMCYLSQGNDRHA